MAAAAEHLTPVTLELGGKSPVIVAADADVELAAARIVWGKCVNAGQTCVAPDHVWVPEGMREKLVEAMGRQIRRFYGPDPWRGRTCRESSIENTSTGCAGCWRADAPPTAGRPTGNACASPPRCWWT